MATIETMKTANQISPRSEPHNRDGYYDQDAIQDLPTESFRTIDPARLWDGRIANVEEVIK